MDNRQFIKAQVSSKLIEAGIPEMIAYAQGDNALRIYDQGLYSGKPYDLIVSQINLAKKAHKKEGKAK